MKTRAALLIFLILCQPLFSFALEVPKLQGHINDYAGMISPATESRLAEELKAFEESDSTQIVILTVPSLEGENIESFGIKVAEAWKIGQKNKDNGLILIVAKEERKIRIEVGKGLEGRLTDLLAGRIIDLSIKPRFKRGDFEGGFTAGVSSLIDAARGEFKAGDHPGAKNEKGLPSFFTLFIVLGVALLVLGSLSRVLGGAVGALGLPLIMQGILSLKLLTLVLFGLLGLAIGIMLPALFSLGGLQGRGGLWSGGGFFGSGGGGSSGDWGGGFSGGGGDFGGGGASGDW